MIDPTIDEFIIKLARDWVKAFWGGINYLIPNGLKHGTDPVSGGARV